MFYYEIHPTVAHFEATKTSPDIDTRTPENSWNIGSNDKLIYQRKTILTKAEIWVEMTS